jgi:hypothetical protein
VEIIKPKYTNEVIRGTQNAKNIAAQVKRAIIESKDQAELIKQNFKGKNPLMSCFNVYNYCRNYIKYNKESANLQTAKTLSRILSDKKNGYSYGDCKHYTIFCSSILRALGIKTHLRLISQNFYNAEPTHIYCVAIINGKEIIVDGCMKSFDNEAQYKYKYNLNIK